MSAPAQHTRATLGDLVETLGAVDGDTALDYLETLLDVLKLVARTESLEEKAKSSREQATYAELWLDKILGTVQQIRKDKEG